MPTLISTAEAAKRLGLSAVRVRELCLQRRIKGARLIGRVWMIPEAIEVTPGSRGPRGKAAGRG